MPRTSEKLTKHTMWLYPGDFSRLSELYPEVGASLITRTLIRKHLEKIEAQLPNEKIENIKVDNL